MYKIKWEKCCWGGHIAVMLLGVLLVFGTLYRAGSLTSGYHMLDDHELIRYHLIFTENQASLTDTIKSAISTDMSGSGRFRPLYWAERVTAVRLFGDELTYWNYYTAVKGIITFYFLYYTARYLKYNRIISFIFVSIIMFGSQFTPWYRCGNQESTGLLLCAFTLYFIARQYNTGKYNSILYNTLIVIGAMLCGLIKESFTLFMPVFIALKFWLEYCDKKDFVGCLKENAVAYAIIFLSMAVNTVIILFYVGVDHVSYAGFHEETSLADYWSGIVYSLKFNLKSYTIAGGIFLFAVAMCAGEIERKMWKEYLGYTAIGSFVLVVQLVAHAKSLMWERYMIPWIVGYAFLFVLLGYRIFEKNRWRRTLYTGALTLLLLTEGPRAYQMSRDYAYTGQMLKLFFQNILDNTEEESHIICAFYDGELNLATECWLETHDRTQVYSCNIDTGVFTDEVQLRGSVTGQYSWENAKVAVCYGHQVEQVLEMMGFTDEEQYNISDYSSYYVISRL